MLIMKDDTNVTTDVLQEMQEQSPESEKEFWITKGAQIINGIYTCPNNKCSNGQQY